ncbi:MAG: hypothetical protein KYX64_06925 [Sphingopyxis sp.]|nr:hypothetical protein [Sphingopyxis sp.]
MAKFDMGAAWDDSLQLLKAHVALTATIAGVFLFLPTLAVAWFGPVPIEPPPGADLTAVIQSFQENFRQMIPGQIVIAISTIIGTAGILRLWLSRTGTSVGEALLFALRVFPTMLAIQILCGFAVGFGFLLLLVPGLYLVGRLALVAPAVADRGLLNPFEAIGASWQLTRDNGWAIFFFLFLVALVIIIAAMIVGFVVALVAGTEPGFGRMLGGFIEAAFGAIGSLVSIAVSAAVYRQLSVRTNGDLFA